MNEVNNTAMNTSKLMEMYKSTFQPALKEGVYEVKMISHKPMQPSDPKKAPYIRFEFEVLDTKRKLVDNRFERGFGIMVSHLRQQLNREDEALVPTEFFDELIKNETPFKIWVTKYVGNGIRSTNFNFIEPLESTEDSKPNTTVVED